MHGRLSVSLHRHKMSARINVSFPATHHTFLHNYLSKMCKTKTPLIDSLSNRLFFSWPIFPYEYSSRRRHASERKNDKSMTRQNICRTTASRIQLRLNYGFMKAIDVTPYDYDSLSVKTLSTQTIPEI